MDDTEMDIVLRAVDDASDTFEQVQSAAEDMGDSMQESAEQGSDGMEQMEESAQEAVDPLEQISTIIGGLAGAEIFSQLADALWDVADKAGTFEDSLMRARLEAEGAGIDVNAMTDTVSELGRVTGRAGSEIRESFITATARGITDLDSFKQMMVGAGAQATLLGTDIDSMANKMSGLAMRSSVMERTLANTGITVEELGNALGIQGATIDDINAKWETMDTNQRAAALGMAASMNEGATANEEYKKSWAGLQAQVDIAKGRLERLAGEVLLPVLIPALEVAARVLNFLGDTISALMDGPLGGLISVIGAVVAGFALIVPAVMAVQGAMALYTASLAPAITATWALLSPWLPFIAIGAAIVALIYEIGKAFGWWTDASSAIDAVWAGVQRLWSAFINHPDVQGFIQGMQVAWEALQPVIKTIIKWVKSFFKASGKKDFDLVRKLINAIGVAWRVLTTPIRTVINVVRTLWNMISSGAKTARNTVNNIGSAFRGLPGRISGAVGGVTSAISRPFTNAYNKIIGIVDRIKAKASSIGNISLPSFWGGEDLNAYGGSDLVYSNEKLSIDMNQNINLSLDLRNVPSTMDERQLAGLINETLDSKEFITRLVNNPDFQSLDGKVKQRIILKSNRANGRGV